MCSSDLFHRSWCRLLSRRWRRWRWSYAYGRRWWRRRSWRRRCGWSCDIRSIRTGSGWSSSWTSVARQCNRRRIVLDDRRIRIRQIATRRPFRRGIQVDCRRSYRRIQIEGLWRNQQSAIKRAELLTFIGVRTVTLGATLHLHGPLKLESD